MKYKQQYDGEWVRPRRKNFKMICCDCSLVHRVDFRIRKGVLEMRAFRDARATSSRRRTGRKEGKIEIIYEKKQRRAI